MKQSLLFATLAAFALTGCGNDPDASSFEQSILSTTKGKLGKADAAGPGLTRETLAQVVTPVMQVTIDQKKQSALIAKVQTNNGVETWSSVDDVTISLKNGVIVATRGFGADLMAAAVSPVSPGGSGGQTVSRIHTVLDGEDHPVRTQYSCSRVNAGSEPVEIVGLRYDTRRVSEACQGGGVSFQNDYWFSGDQRLRKSRQWISEDAGYLIVEDLRN